MKYLLMTLLLMLTGCDKVLEAEVYEGKLLERENLFYKPNSLEPFNGENIEWYENGQLYRRGNVVDGKKDGEWTSYHQRSGKLMRKESYIDGKKDGLDLIYNDNDKLDSKRHFKNGNLNGLAELYHDNGQLEGRGNYIDGKKHGFWERYRDNGKLRRKGSYIDGKRDGLFEFYTHDGWSYDGSTKCFQNDKEIDLSICKQ